ncbi:hypothetical protein V8C86DRAFT_2477206 [Haematococcus lacustris]
MMLIVIVRSGVWTSLIPLFACHTVTLRICQEPTRLQARPPGTRQGPPLPHQRKMASSWILAACCPVDNDTQLLTQLLAAERKHSVKHQAGLGAVGWGSGV